MSWSTILALATTAYLISRYTVPPEYDEIIGYVAIAAFLAVSWMKGEL